MKITMKIPCLMVVTIILFTSLCYAAENITISTSAQAQIEAQTREMTAVGVPAEPARNMLMEMHQHRFTNQNIVRAQQEVMNCAKAGLPTEPVMNKASEGMAKRPVSSRSSLPCKPSTADTRRPTAWTKQCPITTTPLTH